MRRFPLWRTRRPARYSVRSFCQVVRERDFLLVADRTTDLSASGLLVPTRAAILTGETLVVSLRAPLSRTWIDTEATVARVLHGRRPGEHGRSLGLHFEQLDGWHRWVLEKNLPFLRIAPPGFRPGRRRTDRTLGRLLRSGGAVHGYAEHAAEQPRIRALGRVGAYDSTAYA